MARATIKEELPRADVCWLTAQVLRWWKDGHELLPKIAAAMPVLANYCDARMEADEWTPLAASYADLVCYAVGGLRLRRMVGEFGFQRAAFLPGALVDFGEPDWEAERDIPWFFSGAWPGFGDGTRQTDLVTAKLAHGSRFIHPGAFGTKPVGGTAHSGLLYRAARGLAISHYHSGWPKYTAHRGQNYSAHGVDVLHRWFSGCDVMLAPDAQVYLTTDEFERCLRKRRSVKRAKNARQFALDNFGCARVAQGALDYLDGKTPDYRWAERYEREGAQGFRCPPPGG